MSDQGDQSQLSKKQLFAKRLREVRLRRGLTQEELAEHCELSADTVRRLEGSKFNPSLETLHKIAGGLQMSTPLLLDDAHDEADELAEFIRRLPVQQQRMAHAVIYSLHYSVIVGV